MDVLVFNKWSTDSIRIEDPGLVNYINLDTKIVPKTGARYAKNRFHKSKVFIVERLINKVMVPGHRAKKHKITSGHTTGKSNTAYNLVFEALEMVENATKKNPVAVLVKAIENAAPREEIIAIEYGGARYPKAVEISPQRRVDLVLRQFVQGAYQKQFNKKKLSSKALADEILAAFNMDNQSQAISKKLELERQADSSR